MRINWEADSLSSQDKSLKLMKGKSVHVRSSEEVMSFSQMNCVTGRGNVYLKLLTLLRDLNDLLILTHIHIRYVLGN